MKTKNRALQIQAVATMASAATCSKEKFTRYLPQVLALLEQLLQITDTKQLTLRAEATQCLGAVAVAVGKQNYGPHLLKYHAMVVKGLEEFDDAGLRESTFMYISELASLMKHDLLDLDTFDDLYAFLLMVLGDDDGLQVHLPDDGFGGVCHALLVCSI